MKTKTEANFWWTIVADQRHQVLPCDSDHRPKDCGSASEHQHTQHIPL